jgi:hypothetical protein
MILVDNFSSLIKHQGGEYIMNASNIEVKDFNGNLLFIFSMLNSNICSIYDTAYIDGFMGNKYKYINSEVVINPDFVQPEE